VDQASWYCVSKDGRVWNLADPNAAGTITCIAGFLPRVLKRQAEERGDIQWFPHEIAMELRNAGTVLSGTHFAEESAESGDAYRAASMLSMAMYAAARAGWTAELSSKLARILASHESSIMGAKKGGNLKRKRYQKRDDQIRSFIQAELAAGANYRVALQRVIREWDASRWGKQVTISTLRNRFSRKSFTYPGQT
jgi:hypothetical protein